jgi:quinolinate synthase
MYRIDLPHLCWVLENLVQGKLVNEVKVDWNTRKWATIALERMLAIKGTGSPAVRSPVGTTVD